MWHPPTLRAANPAGQLAASMWRSCSSNDTTTILLTQGCPRRLGIASREGTPPSPTPTRHQPDSTRHHPKPRQPSLNSVCALDLETVWHPPVVPLHALRLSDLSFVMGYAKLCRVWRSSDATRAVGATCVLAEGLILTEIALRGEFSAFQRELRPTLSRHRGSFGR